MDTKLLKQKILDLAIRGKLVPQDPNDEPASVLLERIRAEREQLIKQGKLKRSKSTSDNQHYQNVPFEIPASWTWVKLDDFVLTVTDGDHQPPPQSQQGVPFLVISDVNTGVINFENARYVSQSYYDSLPFIRKATCGDILFTVTGSYGIVIKVDTPRDFCFQRHIGLIKTILCTDWLYYALQSQYVKCYCDDVATGTAQKTVSLGNLRTLVIPIPPLKEQVRIVAELERLFAIIDSIENSKCNLQESIRVAKSKILDLAIHGKLVLQDPNDEPASELLKRIAPHATPCDTSHYENLPHNWSIARLESLCQSITSKKYQIKQSEIKEKGKYPVISQSANYIEGYSDLTDKVYSLSSPLVIFGDHTRIVKYVDFNFIVGADGVKILQPLIFPKYFYFLTEYSSTQIENRGYGRHYGYLSQYEVPIPPIEEQEKIVSKLEEIFETIDKITAEL